MGEVYEVDHLASGRRVALKVLRNRLQSQDERARFLREGQLAASVSHPHTVYIFGSEEIGGTPVISMELLTGGTLKDRVTADGPMRAGEAVAAVMDLIGGLDAAAAAGILHRDIKPSNCFIDQDGVVKVGDFGLSISTLARDVHQQLVTSGFEGTPQFAPPEQLRGEPLDVRADIYAVGATLYYLLTGRAPFDATDLPQLFKKVTTETAIPPRQLRRDIPPRLSAVVMQCLAKTPAGRPASYPALADELRPFLARHDKPAPFVTRALAGVLDSWIIVGLPVGFVTVLLADPIGGDPVRTAILTNWTWVATFLYYLALEGAIGASLGKRLLRLRVVSADGTGVSWGRIAVRTTVFYLPSLAASIALFFVEPIYKINEHTTIDLPRTTSLTLAFVMFFATARRRNGLDRPSRRSEPHPRHRSPSRDRAPCSGGAAAGCVGGARAERAPLWSFRRHRSGRSRPRRCRSRVRSGPPPAGVDRSGRGDGAADQQRAPRPGAAGTPALAHRATNGR
jgi:uncharacterized RDD family membrane protein YckC